MFNVATKNETFGTVIANKGGSFDFDGNAVSITSGYAVSVDGLELSTPLEGLSAHGFVSMCNDIVRKVDGLVDPAKYVIGAWIESGTLYIDLSELIQERDVALKKAVAGSQLVIWDFENDTTIPTEVDVIS